MDKWICLTHTYKVYKQKILENREQLHIKCNKYNLHELLN